MSGVGAGRKQTPLELVQRCPVSNCLDGHGKMDRFLKEVKLGKEKKGCFRIEKQHERKP